MKQLVITFLVIVGCMLPQEDVSYAAQFEDVEIRVVRPRYFNKSGRLELGAQVSTVMNETFIYTFMATGLAAFHMSESLALEGSFSYGTSINKEDKRILFDEFE